MPDLRLQPEIEPAARWLGRKLTQVFGEGLRLRIGGGSILAARHRHRLSTDLDLWWDHTDAHRSEANRLYASRVAQAPRRVEDALGGDRWKDGRPVVLLTGTVIGPARERAGVTRPHTIGAEGSVSDPNPGRVTGMPRRVEALKPQAEFAERAGGGAGGSRRPRTRIVGRVLKQHCCGMEAEKRASDETLCQVLDGDAEEPQGEYEIRWAFETMGPDALAALHAEGNVSLDRLAAAKRRSQSDPKQEDSANAWLNAALAKEQGLKLEQQIQDLAAHAKKAPLAILAGAGISKPLPSGVPLYHELAIELAGATPRQAAEDPGACFDRLHKERGRAIYEQAAERIRGRTEPNGLHRRVVALHSAAGSRTIITTNWDELIEAAGAARDEPLRVWPEHERGPGAGHRASGLVHLHGTVGKPGGMLLTKTDLERHYTQERERRFVGELVGDRSMLCIGYSHRDVMIRKIQESVAARERAREGEDGQGSRNTFSLVKRESGKPGWEDDLQRLEAAGIEPVLYDRHEEVPEILDRVARAIAQDAEAERRRLEATAKQGPQPDTDWDEIGRLLEEDGPRLEPFLREAAPEAWAAPEFMQAGAARVLRDEAGGPGSDRVSRWLCSRYGATYAITPREAPPKASRAASCTASHS